jgi:hypothetical protein
MRSCQLFQPNFLQSLLCFSHFEASIYFQTVPELSGDTRREVLSPYESATYEVVNLLRLPLISNPCRFEFLGLGANLPTSSVEVSGNWSFSARLTDPTSTMAL